MKALIAMVTTTFLYCAFTVSATAVDAGGAVEDIYVVRSLRLSRIQATSFCAASRTGVAEMNTEDQYWRRFRPSRIRSTINCHDSPLEEEERELNRHLSAIDAHHSHAPDRLQRPSPASASRSCGASWRLLLGIAYSRNCR
jgi:hypothetical protein